MMVLRNSNIDVLGLFGRSGVMVGLTLGQQHLEVITR